MPTGAHSGPARPHLSLGMSAIPPAGLGCSERGLWGQDLWEPRWGAAGGDPQAPVCTGRRSGRCRAPGSRRSAPPAAPCQSCAASPPAASAGAPVGRERTCSERPPPPRPGPPGPAPLMTPRAKCSRAPRGGGEQAQGASGLLRAPAGTPPHLAPASVPRYHLTRDNTRFPVCPPGPREVLCTRLRGLEAAAVGGGLRPHFIGEETEAGPQQGDSGAPLLSHTHFSGGTKLRGRDVETGRGRWDSARAKATSDGDVLPGPARVG